MTLNEFRAAVGLRDFPEPDLGDMIYFQLRAASGLSGMSPLAALSDAQTEADVAKILSEGFARLELAQGGAREGGSTAVQTTPSASKWQLVRPQDAKMRQAEQQRLKQYGDELYALADKARQGQIDKEQFVIDLKALSRDSLVAAYVLGMLLGDDELTDEEFASVYTHIQKAEESAANLGEDIYAGRYGGVHRDEEDEGQPASLTARTALWVGAAAAVIVLGRTWRRDDPELMWRRGATEEPCNDCLAFEGTTMKASVWRATWDAERLPRGHGLECGGWNCECDLYVVA
jgi:hypothetical protein